MNIEQQREAIQAFTKKMIETVEKKGNDYANQDRLSNFKNVGNFFDDTPQRICLEEMVKKMYRLKELLLFDKIPNNETIEDSLIDLANYSFLLCCILDEKKHDDLQSNYEDDVNFEVTDKRKDEIAKKHCLTCNKSLAYIRFIYKSRDNNCYCDRACFEAYEGNKRGSY